MSDEIRRLTEKLKAAQIEVDRATKALYTDVHDDNLNAAYNRALLSLERIEAELDQAVQKFVRKF
jgi:uncharacterized protein Yka (UPF0111/DUF47 family)